MILALVCITFALCVSCSFLYIFLTQSSTQRVPGFSPAEMGIFPEPLQHPDQLVLRRGLRVPFLVFLCKVSHSAVWPARRPAPHRHDQAPTHDHDHPPNQPKFKFYTSAGERKRCPGGHTMLFGSRDIGDADTLSHSGSDLLRSDLLLSSNMELTIPQPSPLLLQC